MMLPYLPHPVPPYDISLVVRLANGENRMTQETVRPRMIKTCRAGLRGLLVIMIRKTQMMSEGSGEGQDPRRIALSDLYTPRDYLECQQSSIGGVVTIYSESERKDSAAASNNKHFHNFTNFTLDGFKLVSCCEIWLYAYVYGVTVRITSSSRIPRSAHEKPLCTHRKAPLREFVRSRGLDPRKAVPQKGQVYTKT